MVKVAPLIRTWTWAMNQVRAIDEASKGASMLKKHKTAYIRINGVDRASTKRRMSSYANAQLEMTFAQLGWPSLETALPNNMYRFIGSSFVSNAFTHQNAFDEKAVLLLIARRVAQTKQ